MQIRRIAITLALFAMGMSLTLFAPSSAEAQPKGKGPPKPNAFRVQLRHPGWKKAAFPNPVLAQSFAIRLRASGWPNVQILRPRANVFVVRAKMARWQNRAIVSNPSVAASLAQLGRSQGFQARVVPFHR